MDELSEYGITTAEQFETCLVFKDDSHDAVIEFGDETYYFCTSKEDS